MSDLGVDVSRRSSLFEFAALFRYPHPLKMAVWSGIQADEPWTPQVFKALGLDICIPGIIGVSIAVALLMNEDNARLNPHFLPYDGLWIASDKVLVSFYEVTVGLALNPILGLNPKII
jgi:hypothetical protein